MSMTTNASSNSHHQPCHNILLLFYLQISPDLPSNLFESQDNIRNAGCLLAKTTGHLYSVKDCTLMHLLNILGGFSPQTTFTEQLLKAITPFLKILLFYLTGFVCKSSHLFKIPYHVCDIIPLSTTF